VSAPKNISFWKIIPADKNESFYVTFLVFWNRLFDFDYIWFSYILEALMWLRVGTGGGLMQIW
jgi:hypothetical protein